MRRAKLYYLRGRVGKRARVAERRWGIEDDLVIAAEETEAVDSEGVAQSEAEPEVVDAEEEETEGGDEASEETSASEGADVTADEEGVAGADSSGESEDEAEDSEGEKAEDARTGD